MDSDYVLLAFTDKEPVRASKRLFKENFIGGKPFFSPELSQQLIHSSLDSQRLTCTGCQSIISFIAQINCPVDDDNDRAIHVFACVGKSCPDKKWLVTRTVSPMIESDEQPPPQLKNGNQKEWLSDEDDWDDDPAEDCAHQPSTLHRSSADEIGESISVDVEGVSAFQAFYLIVEEEEYLLESDRKSSMKGKKVDISELPDQDIGPVSDAYEKFLIPGTDEVSNKFIKKISKFPEQVIRYNLDGQPLLNQATKVAPADCEVCGSRRRFELQLTPGLINALSLNQDSKRGDDTVDLDFGTVLIFTCEKDCGSRTLLIEEAIRLADADDEVLKVKVEELNQVK